MKQWFKKIMVLMLAILTMASVFLAGCTNSTDTKDQGQEKTPVTLKLWATSEWDNNTVPKEVIAKMKEEGINIEVETFQDPKESKALYVNAMKAGNGPDIGFMNLWWVEEFAANGYLVPLDGKISEKTINDILPPFRTNSVVYNGKTYATWINTDCAIIIYNKEMFKNASIKEPALGSAWTIDEFIANAQKLTKDGVWGVGVNAKNEGPTTYTQFPFFWMYGGELFDESGWPTFNSQAAVDSFNLYHDMIYKYKVTPKEATAYSWTDTEQGFAAGKYAMMLGQPGHVKRLSQQENLKDKVGVMLYPVPNKNIQSTTIHGGWTLGIFSQDPAKQAAALRFIEYLQSPKINAAYAKEKGALPVIMSAYDSDPDFQTDEYKTYREQLKSAKYKPGNPIFLKLMDEYTVALIETLMNQKPAQEALDDAYNRVVSYGLEQNMLQKK